MKHTGFRRMGLRREKGRRGHRGMSEVGGTKHTGTQANGTEKGKGGSVPGEYNNTVITP